MTRKWSLSSRWTDPTKQFPIGNWKIAVLSSKFLQKERVNNEFETWEWWGNDWMGQGYWSILS